MSDERDRRGLRERLRSRWEHPTNSDAVGDPRERHFTMNTKTGEIRPAGVRERQAGEERWVRLGELDRDTGRSTVDYSRANAWRPLAAFWRDGGDRGSDPDRGCRAGFA